MPAVPVGWELSCVEAVVPAEVVISLVREVSVVPAVVVRSVAVVVARVVTVVVVAGFAVVLFLSLPQAKSAKASARTANIARIFFIVIS